MEVIETILRGSNITRDYTRANPAVGQVVIFGLAAMMFLVPFVYAAGGMKAFISGIVSFLKEERTAVLTALSYVVSLFVIVSCVFWLIGVSA